MEQIFFPEFNNLSFERAEGKSITIDDDIAAIQKKQKSKDHHTALGNTTGHVATVLLDRHGSNYFTFGAGGENYFSLEAFLLFLKNQPRGREYLAAFYKVLDKSQPQRDVTDYFAAAIKDYLSSNERLQKEFLLFRLGDFLQREIPAFQADEHKLAPILQFLSQNLLDFMDDREGVTQFGGTVFGELFAKNLRAGDDDKVVVPYKSRPKSINCSYDKKSQCLVLRTENEIVRPSSAPQQSTRANPSLLVSSFHLQVDTKTGSLSEKREQRKFCLETTDKNLVNEFTARLNGHLHAEVMTRAIRSTNVQLARAITAEANDLDGNDLLTLLETRDQDGQVIANILQDRNADGFAGFMRNAFGYEWYPNPWRKFFRGDELNPQFIERLVQLRDSLPRKVMLRHYLAENKILKAALDAGAAKQSNVSPGSEGNSKHILAAVSRAPTPISGDEVVSAPLTEASEETAKGKSGDIKKVEDSAPSYGVDGPQTTPVGGLTPSLS